MRKEVCNAFTLHTFFKHVTTTGWCDYYTVTGKESLDG